MVSIYHNQIGARGDKLNTENKVFAACEEAVEEIHRMMKRLTSANNIHFIITADHSYISVTDLPRATKSAVLFLMIRRGYPMKTDILQINRIGMPVKEFSD